jgi:hypothetical protein
MNFVQMLKQVDTSKYIEREISIDDVKAQYNPKRFKSWLSLHSGPYLEALNMSYSPHYRFLKQYSLGEEFDYLKTPYYELQRLYGRKYHWILKKINKFLDMFEHIKSGKEVDLVQVVSRPFISNKFNQGIEIFEGHHRVACYLVLGVNKILCQEIQL